MKLRRKLQNPIFLVGQGFLAGAVLFFASAHDRGEARSVQPAESALTVEAGKAS